MLLKKYPGLSRLLGNRQGLLFVLGFAYALYWQAVAPIQYTGDSDTYLSVAQMLLGHWAGNAPIFRPPGHPLFLLLTGVIFPGTFKLMLLVQALFAGIIPVLIYRIVLPYGRKAALSVALISIFSGGVTVHTPQTMTEPLFTLLLFLAIAIAVQMVRSPAEKTNNIYWFAIILAFLNTVRPIGALMFWPMLAIIALSWWRQGLWPGRRKKIAASALIFIAAMAAWTIADDVLFSVGSRYSPLNAVKVGDDNKLVTYLYDLPFNEAYYDIWARRVAQPDADPSGFASLDDRPAMAKVRDIVRTHIAAHRSELKSDKMDFNLFGKFAGQPDNLAYRMFAEPNYLYGNYIRAAIETDKSRDERLQLYRAAAQEIHRAWPMRWVYLFAHAPQSLLMGPGHSAGGSYFLIAYSTLRAYRTGLPPDERNGIFSTFVSPANGPASRLMFSVLKEGLNNHHAVWDGYNRLPEWGLFKGNVDALIENMMAHPNQDYAWFMQVMLWNLMGYDTGSDLMGHAAFETYHENARRLLLRSWNSLTNVAAGPGLMHIDSLSPDLATVDIYGYLETPQLKPNQIKELQATKPRYEEPYLTWQAPVERLYEWFYLTKPLFLITCLIGFGVLCMGRRPLAVPILLLIPYGISVGIYGVLFTALPRYTDPTIIIPVMITFMGLASLIDAWKQRVK